MQQGEQQLDTDANLPAVDAIDVSASIEPLVFAVQSLYRAYQKTSIYPQGHPAVPQALAKAINEFEPVFDTQDTILLGIGRDRMTLNDVVLKEASGAVASLAALLHDLDVAALEFYRGLTVDELHEFVRVVGEARRAGATGADLVALLEERELEHLIAIPIDYQALQFADGIRQDSTEERHEEVWDNLATVLTDPSVLAGEISPTELARQVSSEIRSQEGTGVAHLRKRIRRMSDSIRGMDARQRSVVRLRLQEFVSALNPDLRGDLLSVDVAAPSESLALISELADVVPEPDLLDALQAIDRVGGRVPQQMLTLMSKLVRISSERPSLASGLEDTLEKWGVPIEYLHDDSPTMRQALEEIFQARAEVEYNPAPYQDLLDDLAKAELDGVELPLDSRYRDPRDAGDVRIHAAEIAVQVLGRAGGEDYRAGLFGFVDAASDQLIEGKSFHSMRDAAIHARTFSMLRNQTDDVRRAAAGYLSEFNKEERIKKILSAACRGDRIPEAAINLLGLGGENALGLALDFLSCNQSTEVAKALTLFVAQSGPERVAELVAEREPAGWGRLRPLFGVFREMESTDAVPIVEGLCKHQQPRVRREAYLLLCEIDRRTSALEHHMRRAIADEDQNLVSIAVFRLAQHKTRTSFGMLGAYVRGALRGVAPSYGMGARVVRALLNGDEIGVREACGCLDALRWNFKPDRVTMATVVARVMETQVQLPGVQESLARWTASPAHLIGKLFPKLASRGLSAGGR